VAKPPEFHVAPVSTPFGVVELVDELAHAEAGIDSCEQRAQVGVEL
jgi:hypothetical protein